MIETLSGYRTWPGVEQALMYMGSVGVTGDFHEAC